MSQQVPMTQAGADKLREELNRLKTVERPEVIEAIAEARSHGDLSENAEYEAAKERQGFIEGKIAEYEYKLSMANIINPKDIHNKDRIVFGATVTFRDLDTDKEMRFQIVGEHESDFNNNKISYLSPMAQALIGKEVGDETEMEAPSGVRYFEILKIEYI